MSKHYSKKQRKQGNDKQRRPTPEKHFSFLNRLPSGLPAKLTYDFGPKSVKPTVRTVRTSKPRMDKLTSVERDLLNSVKVSLEIGKAHGHYGYVLKLVKRGYFKQVSVKGRVYTFAPTPEGERARANLNLRAEAGAVLKKAEQRQLRALTSYNSMRTATA